MSYKAFTMTVMGIVICSTLSFASFIFFIDPMWTYEHAHPYNDVQTVIDEREQKTSEIYFRDFDYDTLLVGSSRSTYVDPHELKGMHAYNFSVANVSIQEYRSMIDFAKNQREDEFERIILGLDFFKSSKKESSAPRNLDGYVERVTEPLYRYKNLLSYDVFEYAKKNFRASYRNMIKEPRVYNRFNVARAEVIDEEKTAQATEEKIQRFRDVFYGKNYEYYEEYSNVMKVVRDANPDSDFIIYTTPISTPLFKAMVEEGQLDDYERWLTELVDVFGGVYNFMYPNSVTDDLSNYFDGHHFYPEVGTLIARRVSGDETDVPEDFGVYVTKENLEEHLSFVRGLVDGL
ncbi:hypothetical protein GCM10008967_28850 [Bacillus carboniphilus]|uniref:Uncharacterized protein n=1 Tax=Bacillus carboniphilus TaxID=86663 RepID=A0ABP3G9M1_9BACI